MYDCYAKAMFGKKWHNFFSFSPLWGTGNLITESLPSYFSLFWFSLVYYAALITILTSSKKLIKGFFSFISCWTLP